MSNRSVSTAGLIALLAVSVPAWASYGIYIGRNLTADGSVYLGGSGDEVSSHWLEIVPARDHVEGATFTVGVDDKAVLPGEFIEIPQVRRTSRYLTMNYSEYEGFPPPLTNGGLNEHGVAARDIWSPSREELVEMTPNPQRGPNYSDLSRIVMERARSAREAVEIVGDLIDTWGYSTYGGNSHLFADSREGWVLIDYAGGKGLWIARRLGPDEVFMSYPGYVGEIPLDFKTNPNYLGSDNFIDFAVEQGWYDPASGEPFNVDTIYGTAYVRFPRSEMEEELRAAAPVTLREMLNAVRDPRISKDSTGYGQLAELRGDKRPELRTLWVAPTGSVTTPFIPWRIGVASVPLRIRQAPLPDERRGDALCNARLADPGSNAVRRSPVQAAHVLHLRPSGRILARSDEDADGVRGPHARRAAGSRGDGAHPLCRGQTDAGRAGADSLCACAGYRGAHNRGGLAREHRDPDARTVWAAGAGNRRSERSQFAAG